MMVSLAREHRTRMLAAKAAASAALPAASRPAEGAEATEYELQLARLGGDLRRLREVQSIEKKIELKRELLPAYDAWVQGVLDAAAVEGGRGVQDEIVSQIMIWRIDVGDYSGALPLIEYVLRWSLALPERFNRTAATMIAEEIADAALKALGAGGGKDGGEDFDLELLLKIDELTAAADMHDQVRAKLRKAEGLALARLAATIETGSDGPAGGRRAAIEGALTRLRDALRLNAKVGVKKEIERLERELAKLKDPQ